MDLYKFLINVLNSTKFDIKPRIIAGITYVTLKRWICKYIVFRVRKLPNGTKFGVKYRNRAGITNNNTT